MIRDCSLCGRPVRTDATGTYRKATGVPCTIRLRENDWGIPAMPFAPRLKESIDEVRGAADKALAEVREAFEAYREKKNAGNLRRLEATIANAAPNMTFAAESLTEHAENTVQKARADIEAMVLAEAERLGLEPGDLGASVPELTAGDADG